MYDLPPIVVQAVGLVHADGQMKTIELLGNTPPVTMPVYACETRPDKGLVPPMTARRLGRVQRLGMAAAYLAMKQEGLSFSGDRAGVYVGTGLGTVGDTVDFIENMLIKNEEQPKPAKFVNSVYNAIASQVAMAFGMKGRNMTFPHDAISFEMALERGMRDLQSGVCDWSFVIGCDEINPYVITAARNWGWLKSGSLPLKPLSAENDKGSIWGEGATAILLRRATLDEDLPRLLNLQIRRQKAQSAFRVTREVDFLKELLQKSGHDLSQVDCLLCGANGNRRLDEQYQKVAEAVSLLTASELPVAVYKQRSGEFCTAAAIGTGLAIQALLAGELPAHLRRKNTMPLPIKNVLVYHLQESGYATACWLSR